MSRPGTPLAELFDEDGILIAVYGHENSRRDIMESIREWNEHAFQDMTFVTETDRCVISLSGYRDLSQRFESGWFRVLPPTDPRHRSDWDETYYPCGPDDEGALPYMTTGLGW